MGRRGGGQGLGWRERRGNGQKGWRGAGLCLTYINKFVSNILKFEDKNCKTLFVPNVDWLLYGHFSIFV